MVRKLLLILAALALLAGLTAAPAAAARTTFGIYPKCVVTKAEAKRLGIPRTKPGHLCAAPVRAKRNAAGEVYELTRIQKRTRSWHYAGAVSDRWGRIVAEVVRRPGPVFGIQGWQRCAVTKAEARRLGVPRTKPGALCATPLRRVADGGYDPVHPVAGAWPLVEVLLADRTSLPVAYLVRRPG